MTGRVRSHVTRLLTTLGGKRLHTAAASHGDSGTSVYRAAIDATTATLAARARSYRALILVVAAGISGACLWVLFAKSLVPLVLLLLVGVSVGTFFWLDALRLNHWRAQLLQPWQRRELDFAALNAAILAIPGLPGETVAAMLASLPQPADLAQERQWSVAVREQMATAVGVRDRRLATGLLLKTAMLVVAGVAVGLLVLFPAAWTPTN